MKFIKTIARRDGNVGVEMRLPIQGNQAIFGKIAARIRQVQAAIKRDRLYNVLAVDYHPATDIIRGSNHFEFHLHESNFDVSGSGHISLALMSKDGGRLHWPRMSNADLNAMTQPEHANRCAWCGGEVHDAANGLQCPVCQGATGPSTFQDIDLLTMFKLPDGSSWKKITTDDAICLSSGQQSHAGQSAPIPKDQEVSVC